jgi:hypothetical protein
MMICGICCQTNITFLIDSHLFYAILKYVKKLAFSCQVAHVIPNVLQASITTSSYHRLPVVDQESVEPKTNKTRQHWLDIYISPAS